MKNHRELHIFTRTVQYPNRWSRSKALEANELPRLKHTLSTGTSVWSKKYEEIWVSIDLNPVVHCYIHDDMPVVDTNPDKNHAGFLIALLSAL